MRQNTKDGGGASDDISGVSTTDPKSAAEVRSDPAEEAVQLAEVLLRQSLHLTSREESAQMSRLARMIANPATKEFSLLAADRLERCANDSRTAGMFRALLDRGPVVSGFSPADRFLLWLGSWGSRWLPGAVMPAVRRRLRAESRNVILPAEDPPLSRFLAQRSKVGTRVNVNQLGEAVLGEEEARKRLKALLKLLEREDVDYVSVKISAIFSQINLADWEGTLAAIKDRVRTLYRAAKEKGKFVNLDMEEYCDLELTVSAFCEVLSEDEFHDLSAGIALQAYLPDSVGVQLRLTDWAKQRCSSGGAPIKVRIVKGANLAMERVEAEMHGWPLAPHATKHDTDACFKRMLEFACRPENAASVRLGVGSHNLFDLALALRLRERNRVEDFVEIEMLEGMASAQSRAVQEQAGGLLVYAPVVRQEHYGSALAYLIRRLDENTAPDNFLANLFSLRPGSLAWREQRDRFLAAWRDRNTINTQSNRDSPAKTAGPGFENAPDTDWTRRENRSRLATARAPKTDHPTAGASEIEAALTTAVSARSAWAATDASKRTEILRECARQLEVTRFESIALLREAAMKAPQEADTEVSEAIDFARYYAATGLPPDGVDAQPLGTVVVAPPWNFPLAIPCGGVLAALMAGNTVILKPAPESVKIGWWLTQLLWQAGVPREVLQFVACSDGEVGRRLIEDSRTSAVILTGAFETARRFQAWRPSLKLLAETSGKNALVVSAMADRELAVKDLVKSAFGHSGQKCSAASLGILEAEVYDDENFRRQLVDAAASLAVGDPADPGSIVTPLVQPPGQNLLRALTTLNEGESWLLEPKVAPDNSRLWSPGIKLGVRPGSWFHQTECFGPVLGLLRAESLDEAIKLQNAVPYGLTAGLHSLDETEIAKWKEQVQAGNLYVNRGITGAIVRRQPFGGWKRSCIGPGAKAGGPNYVNLFRSCQDSTTPDPDQVRKSYRQAWDSHLAIEHDPSGLRCESNIFRYRPARGVLLRLTRPNDFVESAAQLASETTGTPLIISRADEETEAELAARLPNLAKQVEFVRTVDGSPGDLVLKAVFAADLNWIDALISGNGRLELTRWVREQSVTETLHRYGNPSRRAESQPD